MARIVVAGYLVRNPMGGYAWQAAHYLLGLLALGHDAWFYEDTGFYDLAYDPVGDRFGPEYDAGVGLTAAFLAPLGLGDRWVFVDAHRRIEHGPAAGRALTLLRDADLVLNVAGVNRIPADVRGRGRDVFVDIDPGVTQIRAETDPVIREMLDDHAHHFTVGENIGTPRSPLPTGGYAWHPTRAPVAVEHWTPTGTPGGAYTTVGRWNETSRDLTWRGETYRWRKRTEWLRCLDLPARTGRAFEVCMDVGSVPDDPAVLGAHGWRLADPRIVSGDPFRYRDYLRDSRGEFTVAKDLNVRLRSGWFSDRAACYLAAGRPVVLQDTAFGDVVPLGPGVHAFRTVDEAAMAIAAIEADYARASAHAVEVARECFAAERVLARLLKVVGL